MAKGRLPVKLIDFDTHIGHVKNYLNKTDPSAVQTRGEMLGMTSAELIKLNVLHSKWTSDNPGSPGVWDMHRDDSTKSKLTRKNVLNAMKEFATFLRPILNRISTSPIISNEDHLALRIAPPVTTRKRPTQPIDENCFTTTRILGGSRIKLICRTAHESNRASKPPRADAVEIAYRLDLPHIDSVTEKKAEQQYLRTADDNTTKFTSTKATFMMELEIKNVGYLMQYYARWINIRHPNLNGPWTGPWTTIIG